jgi:anti-sigma factor RsiW
MNHERARVYLQAYADRELGPVRRFFVGRHVAGCPICLAGLESVQSMRTALRTGLTMHRAPPSLAARIGSALPREAPPVAIRPRFREWGYAGSGLAGAIAGVALTLVLTQQPPPSGGLVAGAVSDHVRSLMENHLVDVETGDRHTVKPWLSARLDLSPAVVDFADRGYPLVGGRLDYVGGHRAAAVVYRRDRHVINLFAFVSPDPENLGLRTDARDGFNVVRWNMGGLAYIAVSDVEMPQLLAFCRLVEGG